ncbi:MAG: homocysteine S-methyltransferase family protein [Lachnospiraceae bacterium]|nr:homocysteine S-methyltransferase family protein [Lachnospiraceae bacterium]
MKKITLLDGPVGTALWNKAERDGFKKDPVWKYNVEHPEIVAELVREYAEAGSEIILTNTFGANPPAVRRSSSYDAKDVIQEGVRITKEALRGTGIRTAFALGPLSQLLEPYGDLEEDECREIYREILAAGAAEQPDLIYLMTFMDLEMLRIAAEEARRFDIPLFCSLTFEKRGRTIMGNSVDQMIKELSPLGLAGIGMNCSIGPDLAVPVMRQFVGKTDIPLVFKPNAGKPILAADGTAAASYDAKVFADDIMPALEFVDYVGSCCGGDPSYIREIRSRLVR